MSDIPSECASYANSNPDISGLVVLLVDRSWQDAPIALWSFIATSAGLTIAAIAQKDSLTLFQALVVSDLVWLANFGTFVALASYSRQKAASHKDARSRRAFDYKVKFGAMTQTLVSMALTLYMWVKAESFGPQPQCSLQIKYVLFVFKISAIGRGRIMSLAVTSVLAAVYILITLRELQSYHHSLLDKDGKHARKLPTLILPVHVQDLSPTSPQPFPIIPLITTSVSSVALSGQQEVHPQAGPVPSPATTSSRLSRSSQGKRRPKRRRWSSDLDPMLVGIIICQAMVFTYFIVSIELLLKFNPSADPSDGEWSFGQILALIVVIPSALSLTGAIKEHGVKRPSKRKKKSLIKSPKDREKGRPITRRPKPDGERH